MSAMAVAFFKGLRYPASYRGFTCYFFLSGLVLAGAFAFVRLWSVLSQKLTGDDLFAISTPGELAGALHGGDFVVIVTLLGFLWLFLTGFAARGAALRQRERRIAELEAKLSDVSSS